MTRVALIHALVHSMAPVNQAFKSAWPEAVLVNLLDDSLSADLAAGSGGLDASMHQRFQQLGAYAMDCRADAILFTCSAFGPCIEQVAATWKGIPVLKPNEAMVEDAAQATGPVGLIATFAPTLRSMPAEFAPHIDLRWALAEGALDALNAGDMAGHDQRVAACAMQLAASGCKTIALAQFSMARARDACGLATGLPVLTTVDSAVTRLKTRLHR